MSRQVNKSFVESSCNFCLFRKASVNVGQSRSKDIINALFVPWKQSCAFCQAFHTFWKYNKFIKNFIENYWNLVRTAKLCFNCLGTHFACKCRSKLKCCTCGGCHHSLLYKELTVPSDMASLARRQRHLTEPVICQV